MNQDSIESIAQRLEEHERREEENYKVLLKRLDGMEAGVQELLTILQRSKGVVAFVRWTVTIAAGIAAVWAFLHQHFTVVSK